VGPKAPYGLAARCSMSRKPAEKDFMGVPHDLPRWRKNLMAVVLNVAAIALMVRFGIWSALGGGPGVTQRRSP